MFMFIDLNCILSNKNSKNQYPAILTLYLVKNTFYYYQSLFLEMRNATIKYKNWFNPVIQQFANTIEQANQVCIGNWVSMLVAHSLHRLIQ